MPASSLAKGLANFTVVEWFTDTAPDSGYAKSSIVSNCEPELSTLLTMPTLPFHDASFDFVERIATMFPFLLVSAFFATLPLCHSSQESLQHNGQ